MKLHEANTAGSNLFTAYGDNHVEINKVRHQGSLIVTGDHILPWRPATFGDFTEADFADVLACKPELVLLGTGSQLRFPHPRLYAALTNAGIGVDIMDTPALCRTYNILLAEGRGVVAALVMS